MGAVKQLTVPDDVFEGLEKLRRSMRTSRIEALRWLIRRELAFRELDRLWQEQSERNADLSEEEAMRIALEAVQEVRRASRSKGRKR
ncbi:ribbon-helix-helix protein, CopG family [Marinithermus hydrothermalis]|uniref:Ribbon-helix-helix protein CopG domain-containing protein n=1 Tax=Marinithermus hydrothermalis (strain DSM 14884 / JCM 11576 / T1) TaxID=869210 RepID=F2NNM7_MARHT|nr:ribbon-helix-helix protein, CopG family [Marinithermus hydrothermalis]AEB11042.1 hypothetical protein Marky_0282 [Marinithermus hydrothermalis DSM 14884]